MARLVVTRVLMLVALVLALAGCGQKVKAPDPVPIQCEATCYQTCTVEGIAWTANPANPEAWYALGDEVIQPLVQRVDTCDTRRRACHVCQLRLQEAGVVSGVPPLPPEPRP